MLKGPDAHNSIKMSTKLQVHFKKKFDSLKLIARWIRIWRVYLLFSVMDTGVLEIAKQVNNASEKNNVCVEANSLYHCIN